LFVSKFLQMELHSRLSLPFLAHVFKRFISRRHIATVHSSCMLHNTWLQEYSVSFIHSVIGRHLNYCQLAAIMSNVAFHIFECFSEICRDFC
jgi:hypothetical protein